MHPEVMARLDAVMNCIVMVVMCETDPGISNTYCFVGVDLSVVRL